ncbi:hypothetical protein GmHk_16G045863 [Glycine max]|nr:hypothetical protein GmHk_16G045863 [Glycine max]
MVDIGNQYFMVKFDREEDQLKVMEGGPWMVCFARVCIKVDLIKLVVCHVWFSGHLYRVKYKGLPRVCGTCECYGHLTRECKQFPMQIAKDGVGDSPSQPIMASSSMV